MRQLLSLAVLVFACSEMARADNLLRNGDFQDDWCTLLPELKNHHWNYSTEVYNRRDYNPDGWSLSGKWEWQDADKPRGQRKLLLASPSRAVQSVNWITINTSAKLTGWPDAGGFPTAEAVRSKDLGTHVPDLKFLVHLRANAVPKDAAKITLAWTAASPLDDPLGEKRIVAKSVAVPEGTYAGKTVEVVLPHQDWAAIARKDPNFAAQGATIPMAFTCTIEYADKQTGTVELLNARLDWLSMLHEHLLPNGGFETLKDGWPVGWSKPQKYRYFPPGLYYVFNTWHNSNSANTGSCAVSTLVHYHHDKRALQMIVPPGDEVCVVSDPVMLNQTEAKLIEVQAMVKTEQLAMFQIDAEDENGKRIDGFNFIHKSIVSVGTNDWRMVRQVFRPSAPLKSIRIKLCARGTNGFTLDGTGHQPQQGACGMVWWDDVEMIEVGSSGKDYTPRGLKLVRNGVPGTVVTEPYLDRLNLGEQMIGRNTLSANLVCLAQKSENFRLELELGSGNAKQVFASPAVAVGGTGARSQTVTIEYTLKAQPIPYERVSATLRVVNTATGAVVDQMPVAFAPWGAPIDLRLGALYLQPNQKQFVRVNFGLSYAEMQRLKELRIEVVRRGNNGVLKTFTVPATRADIAMQRAKIPDGLRGDFRNLLLSDIDVSFLPVQPFADPQRNWLIRATAIDTKGESLGSVASQPFCRLAHDTPQPAITSVKISEFGDYLVNDKPWMPWGVTYGHNPVYDGPAVTAKVHNLAALKMWSLYDRHGGTLSDRALWDINCLRHVEGALVKPMQLEEMWKKNLYASTVFIKPPDAKNPWPDDHLKYLRAAPNVAAVSRGPEEAFGYFYPMTPQQLDSLKTEVDYLRRATGKPVMVGHGGYWTRLEFEKVPFFDIYDPETEPWYPAPLHTDLMPLVAGKAKAVWLRPQMYESVPYERWRYHVYVELMRGARGWQIAHGPGDASLMRGLHAELRYLQPFVYSRAKPPVTKIEPGLEYFTRQLGNKTLIVAATTHGMTFGNWSLTSRTEGTNRVRESADPHIFRDESDGYHATGDPAAQKFVPHGIQYLPHAQKWPTGSKMVTRVFIDKTTAPKNLTLLAKCDGRWTHAATWGKGDFSQLRSDNASAYWFLRTFYRHARGFLGWGDKVPANALELVPGKFADRGALPEAGSWVTLELPLDAIGATDKLLDGVAFMHEGGLVRWSRTALVTPDGKETVVFGDYEDRPNPDTLRETKVFVAGLKKGMKVRVLFEDRVIVAEDGFFVDDFRGADLYQRYGGERTGYGNAPVALHAYEIEAGK